MQGSRFQSITARLSPSGMRNSLRFRRSASSSSRDSSYSSNSALSSTEIAINSIMFQQPSVMGLEEERRKFSSELNILEPRPLVYWGGLEERMESVKF